MRCICFTMIAMGFVAGVCAGDDGHKVPKKPLTAQEILDLSKSLDDAQFRVRDAASKRLEQMGPAELETFRKLDFAANLELKRRAEIIIQRVESRINAESLKKVFSDWHGRQHWFESVQCEVGGKHKVPKGAYTDFAGIALQNKGNAFGKPLPENDLEGEFFYSILLDLAKGRHRRKDQEQIFHSNNSKLNPRIGEDTFDGSVMKCLMPKEKNPLLGGAPEMTIVSGNMANGAFQLPYYPVFFSLGRISTVRNPILPGQLRKQQPREELFLHGKGRHQERNCLILRTQPVGTPPSTVEEFWVDPEREGAIVRYLCLTDERPRAEVSVRYQMAHGHWFADAWRTTVYGGGKPLYIHDGRVTKVAVNTKLADADFSLQTKTGMLVEERTDSPTSGPFENPTSTIRVYRLNADGTKTQVRDPYGRQGDVFRK
jgi:hypothetical protein